MKIVSGRIALDKAIELVSNALPTKDFGDATSGILMEVKEDKPKELILIANSLDVFIKTTAPLSESCEPGVVVPSGKILSNVVSSLKVLKNPIVIEYDDEDNILNLKCGKEYSGSIAHYDSVGFVMPQTDENITNLEKMSIPVRLIKKALSEVAFACGKDKSHIFMTGMFFDQNKNNMNIVGSDAMRMSIISFNSKIQNPKKVILPVNYLELFKKILTTAEIDDSAIVNFYIDDENNMAYFIHENITFGFQTYGEDYISGGYESFLIAPEDCEIRLRVNRDSFISKLDLATAHNSSNQDTILFGLETTKSGLLRSRVGANAANVNTFEIPFPINKVIAKEGKKARKFNVSVNPAFFYDVLGRITEKEVEIGLVDRKAGPIVIYANTEKGVSGDYIHVFSIVD
jgi:DNA polymerase III sliding clamp (beta) subunit (PCNA family)